MGIIVPEYILEDIVEQMPSINYPSGAKDVNFGYGDKRELDKYLKLKGDSSYPLIWLLMPSPEKHTKEFSRAERSCSFIVATLETRSDLMNSQRFRGAFDQFLLPVSNLLIEGISSASATRFINETEVDIYKFPNYSEDEKSEESGTIQLWDAIRMDCRIEFKNSCLRQIKWTTTIS